MWNQNYWYTTYLSNNSSFKGTIQDHEKLSEFASEFGSYCQFDLFGIENSYYQIKSTIDFPSDAQRIAMIQSLIGDKFEDKILMAHDIHTKHRLVITLDLKIFFKKFVSLLDNIPNYLGMYPVGWVIQKIFIFHRKNMVVMVTNIFLK